MKSFDKINGIAAPKPEINIDTDAIIPKQFLKTIERKGLGKYLFYDRRFDQEGKKNNSFILNRKPWDKSSVIVAGDNFGCGSSREHAPWALLDFGIKCVISSSFADIFYNNSFKNGLLPIVIDKDNLEKLMEFSNARSAKSPFLSSPSFAAIVRSFLRSSELSLIIDSIQSHSFVRRKMAALAVSSEKLASSTVSPASANANRTASAPNSSIA